MIKPDPRGDRAATKIIMDTSVIPEGGWNFPNPFCPETVLAFPVTERGRVALTIYNIAGQLVKVSHDGELPPGVHELVWDGRDDAGSEVSAGVYLYCLEVGDRVFANRMLLMR